MNIWVTPNIKKQPMTIATINSINEKPICPFKNRCLSGADFIKNVS
jgi:hypothetical protein